jgi:hypothetical protein
VAIAGAAAPDAGLIDLSKTLYTGNRSAGCRWRRRILFGFGMTLGSGCGSKRRSAFMAAT